MKIDSCNRWFFTLAILVGCACSVNQDLPDVDDIEVNISIERWDQQLFDLKGVKSVIQSTIWSHRSIPSRQSGGKLPSLLLK